MPTMPEETCPQIDAILVRCERSAERLRESADRMNRDADKLDELQDLMEKLRIENATLRKGWVYWEMIAPKERKP